MICSMKIKVSTCVSYYIGRAARVIYYIRTPSLPRAPLAWGECAQTRESSDSDGLAATTTTTNDGVHTPRAMVCVCMCVCVRDACAIACMASTQ